jgi:hypothetical protein
MLTRDVRWVWCCLTYPGTEEHVLHDRKATPLIGNVGIMKYQFFISRTNFVVCSPVLRMRK